MTKPLCLLVAIVGCLAGCKPSSPPVEPSTEEKQTVEEIRRQAKPYLEVFGQRLAAEEELANILGRVTNPLSMKIAQQELLAHYQRSEKIKTQAQALPQPEPDVQAFLQMQMEEKMQAAQGKTRREVQRILQLPGGSEFLNQFKFDWQP